MGTILVKAAQPGRVALWDRDPNHPGGEAFVDSDVPVEVAKTSAVLMALAQGRIVEVVVDAPAIAEKPRAKR